MKKLFALILAMVMLIVSINIPALAEGIDSAEDLIRNDERLAIQANMESREIWGNNFEISLVYDTNDSPKFLLGTTDEGYIILERGTFMFHESGKVNPFEDHMEDKKYYGGPMSYYADATKKQLSEALAAGSIYDILRESEVDSLVAVEFKNPGELTEERIADNQSGEIRGIKRVANSNNYIRRRAFGLNNDDTCSAVAVGIVLNYLTLQKGKAFVPSSWRAELRNDEDTINATSMPSKYPKAHALHRYLVKNCGMGAVSWGDRIAIPFKTYVKNKVPSSYNLRMSWTISPRASTIMGQINQNKPVLVTTTFAGGAFAWHTMAAYGYRNTSGHTELLIHTGWYGYSYNSKTTVNGVDQYSQNETWINEGYATFGYYLNYN